MSETKATTFESIWRGVLGGAALCTCAVATNTCVLSYAASNALARGICGIGIHASQSTAGYGTPLWLLNVKSWCGGEYVTPAQRQSMC